MADSPCIPRPPSFVRTTGCDYCGTIHQKDGRCVSCGAPRRTTSAKISPYADQVTLISDVQKYMNDRIGALP